MEEKKTENSEPIYPTDDEIAASFFEMLEDAKKHPERHKVTPGMLDKAGYYGGTKVIY